MNRPLDEYDQAAATRIRGSVKVDDNGCWLWQRHANSKGYGRLTYRGQVRFAHRVSYHLFVGPIPEGLQLDHLCMVPRCVNPNHLEPVTPQVNTLRGYRTNRTHCPKGHEYNDENLHECDRRKGHRRCREYRREQARQWALENPDQKKRNDKKRQEAMKRA